MESLFARPHPKRGRVVLMLGASLLLHGGIVGIGALWTQPDPAPHSVDIDLGFDTPSSGVPVEVKIDQPPSSDTPEPTTTPPTDTKADPTPPEDTDAPDFAPPRAQTPPPQRSVSSRAAPAVHSTGASSTSHSLPGQQTNGAPGGAPAGIVQPWVMPHPPFLQAAHLSSIAATTVRITTDAAGRVSSAILVKSTGNPVLDNHTVNYVRANWHGPANASRTTEFVYQLK